MKKYLVGTEARRTSSCTRERHFEDILKIFEFERKTKTNTSRPTFKKMSPSNKRLSLTFFVSAGCVFEAAFAAFQVRAGGGNSTSHDLALRQGAPRSTTITSISCDDSAHELQGGGNSPRRRRGLNKIPTDFLVHRPATFSSFASDSKNVVAAGPAFLPEGPETSEAANSDSGCSSDVHMADDDASDDETVRRSAKSAARTTSGITPPVEVEAAAERVRAGKRKEPQRTSNHDSDEDDDNDSGESLVSFTDIICSEEYARQVADSYPRVKVTEEKMQELRDSLAMELTLQHDTRAASEAGTSSRTAEAQEQVREQGCASRAEVGVAVGGSVLESRNFLARRNDESGPWGRAGLRKPIQVEAPSAEAVAESFQGFSRRAAGDHVHDYETYVK